MSFLLETPIIRGSAKREYKIDCFRNSREVWLQASDWAVSTGYNDFDWLLAWVETFGKEKRVEAITLELRECGKLVMICPLMIYRIRGVTVCSWLGGKSQNINSPVFHNCFPGLNADTLIQLKKMLPQVHLFYFPRQPEKIKEIPNPFFKRWVSVKHANPFYCARMNDSYSAWEAARRSPRSRRRLRQNKKRILEVASRVELVQPDTFDQVDLVLETFFCQRASAARSGLLPNPFFDLKLQIFIRKAAVFGVGKNTGLKIFALSVDDKIIAIEIVLLSKDSYSGFAKSMDNDFAIYSPGKLLSKQVLEYVHEKGIRFIDFGIGQEKYKEEWTNKVDLWDSFYPIGFRGYVAMVIAIVLNAGQRRFKQFAFAKSLLKRMQLFYHRD